MREHDEVEQLVVRTFHDHEVLAERGGDMLIQAGSPPGGPDADDCAGASRLPRWVFWRSAAGVIPSLLGTGRPVSGTTAVSRRTTAGRLAVGELTRGADRRAAGLGGQRLRLCGTRRAPVSCGLPEHRRSVVGQRIPGAKNRPTSSAIPSGWIDDRFAILESEGVTVDGVPATRSFGQLDNGHFGGLVVIPVPAIAGVGRDAPGRDRRTHSRQPAARRHRPRPAARRGDRSPPGSEPDRSRVRCRLGAACPGGCPETIAICWYERNSPGDSGPPKDRIETSARVAGEQARDLAAALNDAPAGGNPDVRESCAASRSRWCPDLLLLLTEGDRDHAALGHGDVLRPAGAGTTAQVAPPLPRRRLSWWPRRCTPLT